MRSVILNSNGNGAVTVAFGSSIARVLVILTNGSSRYDLASCYSGQTAYACFGGVPLDQNRPYSFRATVV